MITRLIMHGLKYSLIMAIPLMRIGIGGYGVVAEAFIE